MIQPSNTCHLIPYPTVVSLSHPIRTNQTPRKAKQPSLIFFSLSHRFPANTRNRYLATGGPEQHPGPESGSRERVRGGTEPNESIGVCDLPRIDPSPSLPVVVKSQLVRCALTKVLRRIC